MPAFGDAAALVLPAAPGDTAGAGADPEPLTAQTDTKREQTPGEMLLSWPSWASEPRKHRPTLWAPSMAPFLPFLVLPIVMAPARSMPLSELPKSGKELGPTGIRFSNSHPAVLESSANPKLPMSHAPLAPKIFRHPSGAGALALPRLLPTIEGNPNLGTARSPRTPPLSPLSAEHLK